MRYPYTRSENELSEYRSQKELHALLRAVLRGSYGSVLMHLRQSSADTSLAEEAERLSETYRLLCEYYARGAEDPSREEFLTDIGRRLMTLLRAGEVRTGRLEEETFVAILGHHLTPELPGYFDRLDRLFDYVSETNPLGEEAIEAIRRCDDPVERHLLLSGLFVGAMKTFDAGKIGLLVEMVERGTEADAAIALPALLMLGRRYQTELLRLYPDLVERAGVALHAKQTLLRVAVEELFHAYSTEANDRKFTEEVLPKLRDLGEQLRGLPGATLAEQVQSFYSSLDRQQDDRIEELLSDATERLGALQSERFDMEYSSVKHLKQFPFFREAAHWFYPYIPTHPDLQQVNVALLDQWGRLLFGGRQLIASDRYSFALIPRLDRMIPHPEGAGIPIPGDTPPVTFRDRVRDFLFGAYRYYRLYPMRSDGVDPFDHNPFVLDGPFTRRSDLYTEEQLLDLALRVAHDGHYRSAGHLYERAQRDYGSHSGEVWRGIAAVCMMDDRPEEALRALREAIAEEGVRSGTAERMVSLLIRLGRKTEAIDFIRRVEDELPEPSAARLIGQRVTLLRERGETDEALQAAYKADYLADGSLPEVTLELCELLLLSGRAEEAAGRAHAAGLPPVEGVALIAMGKRSEGIALTAAALRSDRESREELTRLLPLLATFDIPRWERSLIQDTILLIAHETKI